MKKIFVLLLLLGFTQMALAQGTINIGDMGLNIQFIPLPGSHGTNQPAGNATYFQQLPPNNLLPQTPNANALSISISLGTNQASDGWIYEQKADGSLLPIMELTNEMATGIPFFSSDPSVPISPANPTGAFPGNAPPPSGDDYSYWEYLHLTDDQVQSLAAGNWYVEVDYGDDQYLGNLTPSYMGPPRPAITASPTNVFSTGLPVWPAGSLASGVVITPAANKPATVRLDGSGSTDPFYLPLQFSWTDGTQLLGEAVTITNRFQPGTHQISLEANDGYNTGSGQFVLEVISPEDAVNELSGWVQVSYVDRRTILVLTKLLSRAQNSFAHGDARSGEALLADFQRRVRVEMMRTDSAMADWLIEGAQEVIGAVEEPSR